MRKRATMKRPQDGGLGQKHIPMCDRFKGGHEEGHGEGRSLGETMKTEKSHEERKKKKTTTGGKYEKRVSGWARTLKGATAK